MSYEAGAERGSTSAERQPAHAGSGHLVGNILVFVIMFGMFLLGIYLLTWFTPQDIWPMGAIVVLSFLAFFIPQGILGRADSGYNLAEGNRTDEKETSAGVSS
ncbi:MAG: hypothetical protein JWM61_273 [Micrococcaceae bacterium]|jgi:hypothetical protein|uniref:Uncharacterized protein n=1 Tax=Arthrobacter cheniae TaxID=1258888 RepID=A0A3A5M4M9_9MICC|nr:MULTISPECIES: hypothetical protein [Arthrobacter]MCU1631621.1 hypothetical protein [Micrococcaceae bacterium]MEC5200192.1 hypothetical protein [Arthrobacter sp. PL16]RJT80888.1 hypothetical protein D6T63_06700 [Arthrobacter cheniae]